MQVNTLEDYMPELMDMYPDMPESDIRKICTYGLKSLYLHISYGGDVNLNNNYYRLYFGHLYCDSLLHALSYSRKLGTKLRILFKRRKMKWDGYYYFALTQGKYDECIKPYLHKKGLKRKHFPMGNIMLYKLKEECIARNYQYPYIFRVKMKFPRNYIYYVPNFVADEPELVEVKDTTLSDILVTNRKYDILNGSNE